MTRHTGTRRRKITLVFAMALSLLGGVIYEKVQFLILAEMLLFILLASWLYLYMALRGLEGQRQCLERAFENQQVLVKLTLSHRSIFPLRWVYVGDVFGADYSPDREFLLPFLGRGEKHLQYTGHCLSGRGKVFLGPLTVRATDPLGLWNGKAFLAEKQPFVILPETLSLPSFAGQGQTSPSFFSAKTVHQAGMSHEFLGTREYRPGDSLKYIHWPATAHRGKPIIKEFQHHTSSQMTFFLDLSENALQGFKPNTLDYSVKIIASLAKHAEEQNGVFRLMAHGQKPYLFPPSKGPIHLAWILETLALVKPLGKTPLEEVVARYLPLLEPGEEVVIVVATHVMNPQKYMDIFAILQAKKICLTVILLVSPSFAKLWSSGEEDFLASQELPSLLAGRGIQVMAIEKGADLVRALERKI